MSNNLKISLELHKLFNNLTRYSYPFEKSLIKIPSNGIYIKFEKGEKIESLDRIVRIGTHTGNNQLHSRLFQHFEIENQRRSIFRKNIGRCFLNKGKNPYLKYWNLPSTTKAEKGKNLKYIDFDFESTLEQKVSKYIQNNFSFCVFQVDNKEDRLFWESKIIATIAQSGIKATSNWLGNYSPKTKIKQYGLWQIQGLTKPPLTLIEFEKLKKIINASRNSY
jgi:hypothetical protein